MRSTTRSAVLVLAGAAVCGLVVPAAALAHGDDGADMSMGAAGNGNAGPGPKPDETAYPPAYFGLPEHSGLMYAHIALMTLAWVFMLPVGKNHR